MELIQLREARRKIKGVEFVYVGSLGSEPNWFARPLPVRVSETCMKEFVSALAQVRRTYDLLFDSNNGMTALFGEPPEATVRRSRGQHFSNSAQVSTLIRCSQKVPFPSGIHSRVQAAPLRREMIAAMSGSRHVRLTPDSGHSSVQVGVRKVTKADVLT